MQEQQIGTWQCQAVGEGRWDPRSLTLQQHPWATVKHGPGCCVAKEMRLPILNHPLSLTQCPHLGLTRGQTCYSK